MKKSLALLLLAPLQASASETGMIYKTGAFEISRDAVRQGRFEAVAVSPNEIRSNYQARGGKGVNRELVFKFSLNGKDNEMPPGRDHHVFLTPEKGLYETPVVQFGTLEEATHLPPGLDPNLEGDAEFDVRFRVDLRTVLDSFKQKGEYRLYNGESLRAKDFEGVYVAGGTRPLSWDFDNLAGRAEYRLTDPDGDGVYEATLRFRGDPDRKPLENGYSVWRLGKDLSGFPSYQSPQPLVDALYNLSLEEMLLDVRPDGAFMAGEKWNGVWTRDISYSILLSLAALNPEACKTSLMAKVNDRGIIQDTGTGGSWPISSDRMTWALAAWEIYAVTGDLGWLRTAFSIIKKSTAADLANVRDPATRLFRGESSFLDWRQQSYPRWMDPKDIYQSLNLGTNAVHYETYRILARMAPSVGEPAESYLAVADSIRDAINARLWLGDRGYYSQYLYGRAFAAASTRSETLGEALSVLFEIANHEQRAMIVEKTPVGTFGAPCFHPQISNTPPYHNNSVWPFVEAYWTWASARAGNSASVERGLASIYRAAALFLTNKENWVAESGDFAGTEINSSRQLWSVAGNLATVLRVFFGMRFEPGHLLLEPFVPRAYAGDRQLRGFRYRQATLDITLHGWGNRAVSAVLDGKPLQRLAIPSNLTGRHELVVTLIGTESDSSINVTPELFAPETPVAQLQGPRLVWEPIPGAVAYHVWRNGRVEAATDSVEIEVDLGATLSEYQVQAIDGRGLSSFLSEPVPVAAPGCCFMVNPSTALGATALETDRTGFTGTGYLHLTREKNTDLAFNIELAETGRYSLDFRYANGNGPTNTENKAAIRSLSVDEKPVGATIFPQRGRDAWTDWGYTNSINIALPAGRHLIRLRFTPLDENMNGPVNEALLDHLRIRRVE